MDKTKILIKRFKLVKYDFMGYHLNKDDATYHHIIKKSDGGRRVLQNGAVLISISHEYLHLIEYIDFEKYEIINNMFKIFHRKGNIDEFDYILISKILSEFEEEHINDKRAKGKKLIKDEFLRRDF